MNVRTCLLFAVSLCSVATPAVAQNYLYATGSPVYSTSLPIDQGVVNVNNGEIHLEIPLAAKQQRGDLSLSEKLVYDSRIWKIVQNGGSLQWQPSNVPNSQGAWMFSSGAGSGSIAFTSYPGTDAHSPDCQGSPASTQSYTQYMNWTWADPVGTIHSFPSVYTVQYAPANDPHCLGTSAGTASASGYASDGSGYTLALTNYTIPTITSSNGTVYYPNLIVNNPPPQSQDVVDRNGNYWSADANANLVDTSDTAPVLVSTSGNSTYYDVLGVNGTRNRYTVTMAQVSFKTAFNENAVSEVAGSFSAIQKITLPDGSAYSFTYDSGTAGNYGEMTSMTLPTGGVVSFGWTNFLDSFNNQNRWLNSIGKDGGTTTIAPAVVSQCTSSSGCQETQTVTDPGGNAAVYTFNLDKAGQIAGSSWVSGIKQYQGSASNGSLLTTTTTAYTYTSYPIEADENGTYYVTGYYEVPASIVNMITLNDVGVASQTLTTLDSTGGKPTEVKIWNFGNAAGNAPDTDTLYSYGTWSFPTSIVVKDGSGNQISSTTYGYDETTPTTTSGIANHGAAGSSARGNRTSEHDWINTSGTTLDTTMTYDDTGTMLTLKSPSGTTTYGYDGTDTFVTSTTQPTPPSGVGLTSGTSYDSSTGAVTSTTDANNQSTVYKSFDSFNRPQEVDNPDGAITGIAYTPTSASVSASNSATGWTIKATDAYGRASRLNVATGISSNPWYMQDTCYNASGEMNFQSYRFQGQFSQGRVCSGAGDSYLYDALRRVTQLTHGDGSSIKYGYRGRAVETTDENGVSKIMQTDAFGRTTIVCELTTNSSMPGSGSPGACGTDIAGTGFVTSYSYDTVNHKTTITQGAQTRVMQTDSLGRTIMTQEPERGTTTYAYSYNSTGLLVTRSRPQANQTSASVLTTTTTQYDDDGRVISIVYSDGTPARYFDYDTQGGWAQTQANVKGRLQKASSAIAGNLAATIFSYDPMGRVAFTGQCQPSGCYNGAKDKYTPYTWDYAGNLLSAGDGAGTTITLGYTPAEEVTGITSSLSDATHPGTLLSNITNGPFGPSAFTYGNGLIGVRGFDSLGRVTAGSLCSGSSALSCAGGTKLYGYSITPGGSRINQVCDSLLGPCANMGYDDLNRLTARTTVAGTSLNNSWSYDRYGNRWSQGAGSVSYNTADNQEAGFSYDAAGNLSSDKSNGMGHSYSYDAEGNLTEVDGGSTATYYYDALNRRVRTVIGSAAYEYVFDLGNKRVSTWNGTSGALLEENAYWGALPLDFNLNNALHFQFEDWLGSERVTTAYNGVQEGAYGSLPFGDGLTVSGADADPYHFAMLDHDYESGQEHAQDREYMSSQGHWMSPDPYDGSYDWGDPQSLNRYAYGLNNPLALTDPSGQIACEATAGFLLLTGGPAGPEGAAVAHLSIRGLPGHKGRRRGGQIEVVKVKPRDIVSKFEISMSVV